jgi:hypothetical protein
MVASCGIRYKVDYKFERTWIQFKPEMTVKKRVTTNRLVRQLPRRNHTEKGPHPLCMSTCDVAIFPAAGRISRPGLLYWRESRAGFLEKSQEAERLRKERWAGETLYTLLRVWGPGLCRGTSAQVCRKKKWMIHVFANGNNWRWHNTARLSGWCMLLCP